MIICHRIGERINSNFNSLDEILSCQDPIISFDGIYESVYENRIALQESGKKIILFPCGGHTGKDNSWDTGQPFAKFCTWDQIIEMAYMGFEVGYHSRFHRDLRGMTEPILHYEIMPPFPINKFCFPYGYFDEKTIEVVKKCGYKEAFSVFQGDGSQFQQNRKFLNW